MALIAPVTRAAWERSAGWLPEHVAERVVSLQAEILAALHRAGARLLLGTDTGNPFVFPGFAVHEELGHFITAGMTPYEAIRAATHDAAEFLDASEEFGTVAVGLRADLVLLEANPLEDVANVSKRVGVMVRGRWYPESDLRAQLEALASSYSADEGANDER